MNIEGTRTLRHSGLLFRPHIVHVRPCASSVTRLCNEASMTWTQGPVEPSNRPFSSVGHPVYFPRRCWVQYCVLLLGLLPLLTAAPLRQIRERQILARVHVQIDRQCCRPHGMQKSCLFPRPTVIRYLTNLHGHF